VIDFRYHIVSLIAVFLALAVGVVLGAGPLQGSLGDQLQLQIEQLREEKDALRVDLDDARAENEELSAFIDATSGELLQGTLAEVKVSVIELPGTDERTVDALLDRIEQAGGELVGQVDLTARWTDPAEQALRDQTASEVTAQLLIPPPDDATTELVLGQALALGLIERDALATETFSSTARAVYAPLLDADLIDETETPTMPADVVLVVAPASLADPSEATDADAAVLAIEVATVTGFAGRDAVLAGPDDGSTDLVNAVRADPAASAAITTVDSADTVTGQVIAPLALAAVQRGVAVNHYGLAADATTVLPQLPEPVDDGANASDDATEGES